MREFWKIWKYALGSFNDETTKKYDNWICIIRTLVMVQLIITNCFIIAGNIRHWNDLEKDNKISVHFLRITFLIDYHVVIETNYIMTKLFEIKMTREEIIEGLRSNYGIEFTLLT